MNIALAATRDGIVDLLDRDHDAMAFMQAAIDLGYSQATAAGWDAYERPYERELDEHSSFFLEVLEREPPGSPLAGFGLEIAYPSVTERRPPTLAYRQQCNTSRMTRRGWTCRSICPAITQLTRKC